MDWSRSRRLRALAAMLVALAALVPLVASPARAATFANPTSITIPAAGTGMLDFAPSSPYPSTIAVAGISGLVGSLKVTLHNLSHTRPSDLDVLLVGPSSQGIVLMSDHGGNVTANVTLTFDDDAAAEIPRFGAIPTGSYKPGNRFDPDVYPAPAPGGPYASKLSAFAGTDPNGTWSLYIVDDAPFSQNGTLAGGWSLDLTVVNAPPVATADVFGLLEDTILEVAAPGVLANDGDAEGRPLRAALVDGSPHGPVTLNADGSFSFTPAPGFSGTTGFSYVVSDGESSSPPATVTLTVGPVNDPPTAADDAYAAPAGAPLTVPAPGVLANDADPEGNALAAVLASGPAGGTLTLGADGAFRFTPAAGFSGTTGFTYRADDGGAASNVATVTVTVPPAPPTAASADLTVQTVATPRTGTAGRPLQYVVTVTNRGPSAASGVRLIDSLPGVRFANLRPSQGACRPERPRPPRPGVVPLGGRIVCDFGTVAAGGSATVRLVATPPARGTVVNTAVVTAATPDPQSANNHFVLRSTIGAAPRR